MNVVLVSSDFNKANLVSFLNLKADLSQYDIDWLGEHRFSVFGSAYKMIHEQKYVVVFVDVGAHRISLAYAAS